MSTARPGFVHLHNHTMFSALDGTQKMKPMLEAAIADGQTSIAITDHGNMSGAWRFYNAARDAGVKPIIGQEIYLAVPFSAEYDKRDPKFTDKIDPSSTRYDSIKGRQRMNPGVQLVPAEDDFDGTSTFEDDSPMKKKNYEHLTVLAQNAVGYNNLVAMTNKSQESYKYKPLFDFNLLADHAEGIIVGTGCLGGPVAGPLLRNDMATAEQNLRFLVDTYGTDNVFVEVMDHGIPAERAVIGRLVELAKRYDLRVVATNDCHYTHASEADAHDAWLCISQKKGAKTALVTDENRFKFNGSGYHLRTAEEMHAIFDGQNGCEDAVSNSLLIADMCEDEVMSGTHTRLPKFEVTEPLREVVTIPAKKMDTIVADNDSKTFLYQLVLAGAKERYGSPLSDEVKARLRREMDVINHFGYEDYFLIMWDAIGWARSDRGYPEAGFPMGKPGAKRPILVGPGRGCLAGESMIWTTKGYKPIRDIVVGDEVRTHTGAIRPVSNTFEYDVNETMVHIDAYYQGKGITLTKDHKVLVRKALRQTDKQKIAQGYRWLESAGEAEWLAAGDVEVGDLVCVPRPQSNGTAPSRFDLGSLVEGNKYITVLEDIIIETIPTNKPFPFSKRDVSRRFDVARNVINSVLRGGGTAESVAKVMSAIAEGGYKTIEEWKAYLDQNSSIVRVLPRYIEMSDDLCWLIGAWVSDGWTRSNGRGVVGWAVRRSEDDLALPEAVERVFGIATVATDHTRTDLRQYAANSYTMAAFFGSLCPDYDYTARTKSLPSWVMDLDIDAKMSLLDGLWWGDGSDKNGHWKYTTVSEKLADQVRELLWAVGAPAGLASESRTDDRPGFTNRSTAYYVRTTSQFGSMRNQFGFIDDEYVYMRVRSVKDVEGVSKVYDFEVPVDHSFMTDSYIVHNSAAGSCVAYSLKITNVEPIENNLLFERFLDVSRYDFPDIDTDFEAARRDEVITYLEHRWGHNVVARLGTFSVAWAKRAIKDMARVTDQTPLANKLTKMIHVKGKPEETPLPKILDDSYPLGEDLRNALAEDDIARSLVDQAMKVEGVVAGESIHACGIVLGDEPLDTLLPLRKDRRKGRSGDDWVTQWDSPDAGAFGLVKFDFLFINDLDVVASCLKSIEKSTGEIIDTDNLCFGNGKYNVKAPDDLSIIARDNDRARRTWKLLADGKTAGVFQLAGSGITSLTRAVAPTSLDDIAAIGAFYRPGPMASGEHEKFARRKRGAEPVTYTQWTNRDDETSVIEEILGSTLGCIAYQEQLMLLAQAIADFDAAESNKLRKAFSKKNKEMMDSLYERFISGGMSPQRSDGSEKVAFDKQTLVRLWTTFKGSASYLFNASHAYAYGYVGYITAYLKANWPNHFGAALLANVDKTNSNKRVAMLNSLLMEGVRVLPPSVNKSGVETGVDENGDVRIGLSEIGGAGGSARWIVHAREGLGTADRAGYFKSIHDVVENVKLPQSSTNETLIKKLPAGDLEAMIEAGAFDEFSAAQHDGAVYRLGMRSVARAAAEISDIQIPKIEWGIEEKMMRERARLGVSLSGSPLSLLGSQIKEWREGSMRDSKPVVIHKIPHVAGNTVSTIGVASNISVKNVSIGKILSFMLEGSKGVVECVAWPKTVTKLEAEGAIPIDGMIIGITGKTRVEVPPKPEADDSEMDTILSDDDVESAEDESVLSIGVWDIWRGELDDPEVFELTHPESPIQGVTYTDVFSGEVVSDEVDWDFEPSIVAETVTVDVVDDIYGDEVFEPETLEDEFMTLTMSKSSRMVRAFGKGLANLKTAIPSLYAAKDDIDEWCLSAEVGDTYPQEFTSRDGSVTVRIVAGARMDKDACSRLTHYAASMN